jgi:hypothetical protein
VAVAVAVHLQWGVLGLLQLQAVLVARVQRQA